MSPRKLTSIPVALALALAVFLSSPTHARDGFAPTTEAGSIEYFLVVTGGEVLEGVYPDAHTSFIGRTLLPFGVRCVGSLIVDDEYDDLVRALEFAVNRAELVIVTGGLGPTQNDITRETVAAFLGVDLIEDPALLTFLERRFNQPRDQLRPNVRRQALIPQGGSHLPNPHGTAAGIVFPGRPPIVALPGPPRELQPMVRDSLIPYLQSRFGVRPPGTTVTLRFVGAGQSLISQTIDDHNLLPPGITVGSIFEGGRVDFSFSVPGQSEADREQLNDLANRIRNHLGTYLYATDSSTLEDVVVEALLTRGASLAVAEIGTGGLVATTLHSGASADQLLTATLSAPDLQKVRRLLPRANGTDTLAASDPTDQARALALRARRQLGTTWAIAAVPYGQQELSRTAFQIALAMPDDRWAFTRLPAPGPSPEARLRFATQFLDWLRRELANPP